MNLYTTFDLLSGGVSSLVLVKKHNFVVFCFIPFVGDLTQLVKKLKRKLRRCLVDPNAKIVRECADLISVSPCDLFNKSLVSDIFPDDWKCARVTPLFKEGEQSDLNNYRPISVISVIAKVFERIVYVQLYNFLE